MMVKPAPHTKLLTLPLNSEIQNPLALVSTLLIADGMELGVAAAFGAADTMSQGPLFHPRRSGGP